MPISIMALILGALAGVGAVTTTSMEVITLEEIIAWFREHREVQEGKPNVEAVTIYENYSGGVRIMQGFFDADTERFLIARRLDGKSLDEELAAAHRRHQVAIYK